MCRYGFHFYKCHYACFHCRKAFAIEFNPSVCPHCGGELHHMGHDFKAPRRSDLKQWKKVERLFQHGIIFSSCGDGGPGKRPKRLNEVDAFLEAHEREQLRWEQECRSQARLERQAKL